MKTTQIAFEPHVAAALSERHSPLVRGRNGNGGTTTRTAAVNRDLARYYDLLAMAERGVRGWLREADLHAIARALGSTYTGVWAWGSLADEVRESVEDGSLDVLAGRLSVLTPIEECAVLDMVERLRVGGDA